MSKVEIKSDIYGVGETEKIIKDLEWDTPLGSFNLNYIPDEKELVDVRKIGNELGKYLKK